MDVSGDPAGEHLTALAGLLKSAAVDGRVVDAAQVRIIGLDGVRKGAGANWPRLKERIRLGSQHYLQQRLGRGDVLIPCEDGYVIVFAQSEPNLDRRCEGLRSGLESFYLGEDSLPPLRAEIRAGRVEPGGAFPKFDDKPQPAKATPAAAPAPVRVSFAPVWDCANQVVSTYVCGPMRPDGGREVMAYHRDGPDGQSEDGEWLAVDLQVLARAAKGLADALAANRKCIVTLSVHCTTLQHRASRIAYLERLAMTSADLRRYMFIRIAEAPAGLPLITLGTWVGYLRAIAPKVFLEVSLRDHGLARLAEAGLIGVGLYWPYHETAGSPRLVEHVARCAPALARSGLKLLVHGELERAAAARVVAAGADFLMSSSIWPCLDAPNGVLRFPRADLDIAAASAR